MLRSFPARLLLLTCVVLSGCASAPFEDAQRQFRQGNAEAALASLNNPDNHSSRSKLLLYMEKGLILHHLAEYENSTKAFLQASEIMETQDYIRISEQAKTLIVNDTLADYRGEYSEQLLVHSYQMMNYLLLDQYDSAAVEARQALEVLGRHAAPLVDDWFTHALIGLSFESVGKINDAYIEYKKLAEKMPDDKPISKQLYWFAKRLGFADAVTEYQALLSDKQLQLAPDQYGELILFVANGDIPQKVSGEIFAPPDIRISFPRYAGFSEPVPTYNVSVVDENSRGEYHSEEGEDFSVISTRLGDVARESLDARGAALLVKLSARLVAKHAIVNNVSEHDEAAAQLLGLLFFILEEADTRGWGTLPANLTLLRIPLPPGIHNIVVTADSLNKDVFSVDNIRIAAGQRIYRKIRY
jgi:hypothetical protein